MKKYHFIFVLLVFAANRSVAQTQPDYPMFAGNLQEHLSNQVRSLVRGKLHNPANTAIITNIQFRIGAKGEIMSLQFVPAVDSTVAGLLTRLLQTTSFHWTPQTLNGKALDSSILFVLPVLLRLPPGPVQTKTAKEILDEIPSISTDQLGGLNPAVKREVRILQPELCVLLPLFEYRFIH